MKSRKMEGKSMRKLTRTLAAGALAVPMALGASGVAVADVAEDGSAAQNQIGALEGNNSNESNSEDDSNLDLDLGGDEGSDGDNSEEEDFEDFIEELLEILGLEDEENNSGGDNSGILG